MDFRIFDIYSLRCGVWKRKLFFRLTTLSLVPLGVDKQGRTVRTLVQDTEGPVLHFCWSFCCFQETQVAPTPANRDYNSDDFQYDSSDLYLLADMDETSEDPSEENKSEVFVYKNLLDVLGRISMKFWPKKNLNNHRSIPTTLLPNFHGLKLKGYTFALMSVPVTR